MNNVELKLNMLIKEMDHLWNGMFIVGGGAFAFLAYEPNIIRAFFSLSGFILVVIFLNAYLTKLIIVTKILYQNRNEN